MRLPELDERFADWVDGRLSAQGRERLQDELAADPALRFAAEEYRATVELLRESLAGDERAPDDLVESIVGAAHGQGGGWHGAWAWVGLAAAAGVLVYVALPWGGGGDTARDVATAEGLAAPRGSKSALETLDSAEPTGEAARPAADNGARAQRGLELGAAEQRDAEQAKDEQTAKRSKNAAPAPAAPVPQTVLEALEVELRNQRAVARDRGEPVAAVPQGSEAKAVEQRTRKAPEEEAPATPAVPQLVMVVPVSEAEITEGAGRRAAPAPTGGHVAAAERGAAGDAPTVPPVLTAPELLGEVRLGNRLQLTVAPAPALTFSIDAGGAPVFGDQSAIYQPIPGDQLFTIHGSEQELPLYFSRLQSHLAAQGREVQVQWTPLGAVSPPDAYRANGASGEVPLAQASQAGAADQRDTALRSVLLVLRQQAAATRRR